MKQITCTVCPRGCHLSVDEQNDYAVSGNACARGIDYGQSECRAPVRTLTSTVRIENARHHRCPVRTDKPIPREHQLEVITLLRSVRLQAPVHCGDIVIDNVLGTGAAIIATRNMEKI